ncbi:hypothetical protein BKA65DRAFT_156251 [Rhexocercosporidium sp. MPI-PUGE-AT-0058]|nr:hypothetical protein BKA65DRAFT_156251 [Rhexocercosporidium sp. MPI-PUGE-AT-0058]
MCIYSIVLRRCGGRRFFLVVSQLQAVAVEVLCLRLRERGHGSCSTAHAVNITFPIPKELEVSKLGRFERNNNKFLVSIETEKRETRKNRN